MAKPIAQVKSDSFFPPFSSRQRALINPARGSVVVSFDGSLFIR
jgi:hypothetical protein